MSRIKRVAIYAQHQQQMSVILLDTMIPLIDGAIAIRSLKKLISMSKLLP
ncbi:MAG: hypothetical protein RMY34_08490 [Aulosira sp. DedQUE10]|nr:hypothetical protein [Aulosira sp. DedQUE10]